MMKLDEFGIIAKFFQRKDQRREDVIVGSGDDCAVLMPPAGNQLLMTVDTMLADVHFFRDVNPEDLGYKSVAVSLSDVAAMGGEPAWLLATLSIETIDEAWLALLAKGVFEICDAYNVTLIGGDLTRGPLSITTQLTGFVPVGAAICRDGARVGDKIYVTGTLGDAGLALRDKTTPVYSRLLRPTPRVQAGRVLRGLASACIDVSDGLAQDLGHIVKRSEVGARIDVTTLPLSDALKNLPHEQAWQLALTAGDDYELCFTIAPAREVELLARQEELGVAITCIGEIVAKTGVDVQFPEGKAFALAKSGFQHF